MKNKILVIEDEKLICWSLERDLTKAGFEVAAAQTAENGMRLFEEDGADVVLLDIRLPDGDGKDVLGRIKRKDPLAAVIVITANDDVRTAVQCMQAGAFTYLHKPFDFEELKVNIEKAIEAQKLRKKVAEWELIERGKYDFSNVIAESSKMKAVLELVRQVINSEATTVLLEGESGTGKDLIARTIHYMSSRSPKPFVSINCAAIPATLLESELFGHEKGSFTDAKQAKKGLLEEASGGTLFLDEIADMSKDLQAKLLHLIDQKRFRKVGGVKEIVADIRIIAATNRDLKKEVQEGRFREDLYYRLHVIPIYLPPLRERKEDIPLLLGFFIGHFNQEFKKSVSGVSPEAMEILTNYAWPGNVRELKNIVERTMILNQGEMIRPEHLPAEIDCHCSLKDKFKGVEGVDASKRLPSCIVGIPLEAIEREAIILALQNTQGNQSRAAKLLGIGRDALRYKMQKHSLFADEDKALVRENTQPESSTV